MIFTFDVLKEERFNVFNDSHSLNIEFMFVTLDVSKLLKSKLVNDLQP